MSLGSRRADRVAVHDTYEFPGHKTVRYHSIKYHIRSIDPWLDGVCRSHCEKHSWCSVPKEMLVSRRAMMNKKLKAAGCAVALAQAIPGGGTKGAGKARAADPPPKKIIRPENVRPGQVNKAVRLMHGRRSLAPGVINDRLPTHMLK
jgi:hypothetical protein